MVYMLVNQLKYHQLLISFSASQNTGATRGTTKVNLICQSKVMAMPGRIQTALSPLPHTMVCHVAVTWNNATLIWGGYRINHGPENIIHYTDIGTPISVYISVPIDRHTVFHHLRGKWTKRETSGDLPFTVNFRNAQVFRDKMFCLIGKESDADMMVYCLDLHTWKWARIIPSGARPSMSYNDLYDSSWVHDEKIYSFRGLHDQTTNNRLVSYNISTNSWEWPNAGGDIPSPRYNPLISISDDTAFLFGGLCRNPNGVVGPLSVHNDLYILDMPSMTWTKVHGNLSGGEGPKGGNPFKYTFTCTSQFTAVLFGASFDHTTHQWEDAGCWILNLQHAKQLMNPPEIWTKITLPHIRAGHAAVLQPLSKRLWVIGGCDVKNSIGDESGARQFPKTILKLNFNQLRPLKDLAMDCVARNICVHDPRLGEDQMTRQLRNDIDIEAYRCEIGDQYSCPDEDWRNGWPFWTKNCHHSQNVTVTGVTVSGEAWGDSFG